VDWNQRDRDLSAINHGKHVVTANKAVIARYGVFTAANSAGVYVLLEAAVGGVFQ